MPAVALGIATSLTNILRDVGEDAARGRIYLPGGSVSHQLFRADLMAAAIK